MSTEQILLGVPAYGYLQISNANSLIQKRQSVTLYNGNGGTTDGQLDFRSIVNQGALSLDGSGVYEGAGGFTREWDSCSHTVSRH
jgi:chitinase